MSPVPEEGWSKQAGEMMESSEREEKNGRKKERGGLEQEQGYIGAYWLLWFSSPDPLTPYILLKEVEAGKQRC